MSGDALRVAFDVTPLVGFRTGIGLSTAGMWEALGDLAPAVRRVPYAIGLETGEGTLPPGTAQVRLPTRALVAVWSRSERLSMDRWLPAVDVVHATNFTIGPTRRPAVLSVHDVEWLLFPETATAVTATFPGMLRRAIARGAHLHVTTEHVADEVDRHLGPGLRAAGRISVVPFGVPALRPAGPLPPALRARLEDRPYVLALGTQVARKNLPMLVAAFGRVADGVGELRLVLAGPEGPDTPAIRAAVGALAPGVARRIDLVGPVDDATRVALLAGAALLAYPSTYEGFGLPPLEAMSLGVPAVVTGAGAAAEIAGSGAALVDPSDTEGWAEAILRLVTDDAARASMADAGRQRAAGFTWDATGRGLAAIYRRAAASS